MSSNLQVSATKMINTKFTDSIKLSTDYDKHLGLGIRGLMSSSQIRGSRDVLLNTACT